MSPEPQHGDACIHRHSGTLAKAPAIGAMIQIQTCSRCIATSGGVNHRHPQSLDAQIHDSIVGIHSGPAVLAVLVTHYSVIGCRIPAREVACEHE